MQILVFGDSTILGVYHATGSWVDILKGNLNKINSKDPDAYYLTYNLGIDGDKTSDLVERFEKEVSSRLRNTGGDEAVIIFEIGANDAAFVKKLKSNWVPKDKFRENIEALIEIAKRFTDKIIFVGLLPVNEKLTVPVPWDSPVGKISYRNSDLQYYNSVLRVICETQKIKFIDLFNKFRDMKYDKLLYDGVHMNAQGHELMYRFVLDYLIMNKILPKKAAKK